MDVVKGDFGIIYGEDYFRERIWKCWAQYLRGGIDH